MTATTSLTAEGRTRSYPPLAAAAIALGCLALLLRPQLMTRFDPMGLLVGLFVALFVVGYRWPGVVERPAGAVRLTQTAALGAALFLAGRVVAGGAQPAASSPRVVALLILAAVAEEAFFRRLVYGVLARHGAATALVGSAWLFAIVHVTVYGWWALPIDLAAGLVLSWQRWASGTWTVPAFTHAVANMAAIL
ncbi:MAG: lysostaphin resistance A-like protein [Acidimicrobiales bacterium]